MERGANKTEDPYICDSPFISLDQLESQYYAIFKRCLKLHKTRQDTMGSSSYSLGLPKTRTKQINQFLQLMSKHVKQKLSNVMGNSISHKPNPINPENKNHQINNQNHRWHTKCILMQHWISGTLESRNKGHPNDSNPSQIHYQIFKASNFIPDDMSDIQSKESTKVKSLSSINPSLHNGSDLNCFLIVYGPALSKLQKKGHSTSSSTNLDHPHSDHHKDSRNSLDGTILRIMEPKILSHIPLELSSYEDLDDVHHYDDDEEDCEDHEDDGRQTGNKKENGYQKNPCIALSVSDANQLELVGKYRHFGYCKAVIDQNNKYLAKDMESYQKTSDHSLNQKLESKLNQNHSTLSIKVCNTPIVKQHGEYCSIHVNERLDEIMSQRMDLKGTGYLIDQRIKERKKYVPAVYVFQSNRLFIHPRRNCNRKDDSKTKIIKRRIRRRPHDINVEMNAKLINRLKVQQFTSRGAQSLKIYKEIECAQVLKERLKKKTIVKSSSQGFRYSVEDHVEKIMKDVSLPELGKDFISDERKGTKLKAMKFQIEVSDGDDDDDDENDNNNDDNNDNYNDNGDDDDTCNDERSCDFGDDNENKNHKLQPQHKKRRLATEFKQDTPS